MNWSVRNVDGILYHIWYWTHQNEGNRAPNWANTCEYFDERMIRLNNHNNISVIYKTKRTLAQMMKNNRKTQMNKHFSKMRMNASRMPLGKRIIRFVWPSMYIHFPPVCIIQTEDFGQRRPSHSFVMFIVLIFIHT